MEILCFDNLKESLDELAKAQLQLFAISKPVTVEALPITMSIRGS